MTRRRKVRERVLHNHCRRKIAPRHWRREFDLWAGTWSKRAGRRRKGVGK